MTTITAATDDTDHISAADLEAIAEVEKSCPPWCVTTHTRALVEGCGVELSSQHVSHVFEVWLSTSSAATSVECSARVEGSGTST